MNEIQKIENPFGVKKAEPIGALAHATSNREMQEVQAAMVVAQQFPRDEMAATERILSACARPTLAAEATYDYAKGGSSVTGPSIRLAETIAQQWGHIDCGIREIEQDSGSSTMRAYAWDLQNNVRVTKDFKVPHIRHTRKQDYALTDPREIYENNANMGARRMRACILAVIPGDVIEAAVKQCEQTMRDSTKVSPEILKKMMQAFEEFGVSKDMIEARIQRRIEAIQEQPQILVNLRKIHTSLKDGMSKPGDWFPDWTDTKLETKTAKSGKKAEPTEPAENLVYEQISE